MRWNITLKALKRLQPEDKAYFIRSTTLRGFGIKINPSGSIRFIVECKHQGTNHRKTIGNYPLMSLAEAEKTAISFLSLIRSNSYDKPRKGLL